MTGPNFMVADIAATLGAVCLYPLFVFIPGYLAAWLGDLFDFRRRTLVFRVALSIPLSISLCPILTYLAGRFGSMQVVWLLYAACWIGFVPVIVRDLRQGALCLHIPRQWLVFGAITGGWLLLALFSSVDLQFGDKAYYPTLALDFGVRTQFIQSIRATGIPPANPFFFPGHLVPLRYHYFWLLLCSLVDQAGGAVVGPRTAWMGGTIWCGFGFLALLTLYFRLFAYQGPASFRRRALIGVSLACVTGLDIIPTASLWLLRAAGMKPAIFPIMEFWNEQVYGFVSTALWTAHHLASLIACLTAFLLLLQPASRLKYASLAGVALASAAGTSVYVSFTFAVFLMAWTGVAVWKRWWREGLSLAIAGVVGLALFLPYALELRGGSSPIRFWVRPFRPMDIIFRLQHLGPIWRGLLNGVLLPLNYFLALGVFLATAVFWWRKKRSNREPLSRPELALAGMVASSVLVCTFLRSAVINNNDLGWRGFLVAQFGLLFWAVDVLADRLRPRKALLTALVVLGAAGTAYNVLILRVFPILADHDFVVRAPWIAPEPDLGRRNYASRQAYQWADRTPSATSVIQFNPRVAGQDVSAFLYSTRQIAAADEDCLSTFGGDPALCAPMVAKLNDLYSAAPQTLDGVCSSLPIDLIVAKDTDPAWANRRSWVWNSKPLYANSYYRVFGCGHGASGTLARR
jgi:hypothetical protein